MMKQMIVAQAQQLRKETHGSTPVIVSFVQRLSNLLPLFQENNSETKNMPFVVDKDAKTAVDF